MNRDKITLEEKVVYISSVGMSLILDGKLDVGHFISERTHILNTLMFLVKI